MIDARVDTLLFLVLDEVLRSLDLGLEGEGWCSGSRRLDASDVNAEGVLAPVDTIGRTSLHEGTAYPDNALVLRHLKFGCHICYTVSVGLCLVLSDCWIRD